MKKLALMIKKCPLFAILVISAIVISAVGYAGAAAGIYKWSVGFKNPMLQTVLTNDRVASETDAGLSDAEDSAKTATESDASEAKPGESAADKTEDIVDKKTDKKADSSKSDENNENSESTEASAGGDTGEITSGGSAAPITRPTQYRKVDKRKSRNACYRDVKKVAIETDYPYRKVDKSYFDDALFIGDSRVEGLSLYSGLDNATFACMEGLTTFGVMTEKVAANGTETLEELLSTNSYSKIYIMLGINEAGYTTESYAKTYMESVARIQELQPNAVIFMMGCIHVTKEYSDSHDVTNNDNIDDKNGAIAKYADGVKLFYLDVNTVLDDENGGLIKDYTWDEIHLQAQYYSVWENYLYERGLKDDAFGN